MIHVSLALNLSVVSLLLSVLFCFGLDLLPQ